MAHARDRDRFIDALRVLAVSVVVLGHWMTTAVFRRADGLAWENALSVIPESHIATWLLQVMPLLFFVGGFANARSLARHEGDYLAFLRTRLARLLRPTVVFVAVWIAIGLVHELGVGGEAVAQAADVAALPFWFLGLYVGVVALAPPMWRLHRRSGWQVVAVLAAGALAVDVVVHGMGVEPAGVLNYAFVWLLPHQLGYAYADGQLERIRGRTAAVVAGLGLTGMVVLVGGLGYPTSMIGVPGEDRWNTDPPSLALVFLTVWLVGLALLVRPRLASIAETAVGRLNRVALTLYLWHVTVIAVGAAALLGLGFPDYETGTGAWWLARGVWIVLLVPITIGVVAIFRRFEVHPAVEVTGWDRRTRRAAVAATGVVAVALGLLGFGVTGFDRLASDRGESVLGFSMNPLMAIVHLVIGLAVVRAAYSTKPLGGGLTAAVSFLVLGLVGWSDGISLFATNRSMAVLHVALATLAIVALAAAGSARSIAARSE